MKFRQSKGNNSAITDDIPKIHVHNIIIVIYIQYKFHELPFIGYLVMTKDGKTHGWMEKLGLINTHPPLAGDN